MMTLSLLGILAFQYIGAPYKWGGSNYLGFDCSGLIIKVLHDAGLTVPDMTSQQIFEWVTQKRSFMNCEPSADCFLFFGKNKSSITHVALAISSDLMIEAGGAGRDSLSLTAEQLANKDARVRIRPISSRKDLVASIKINY
jgi:cell wall-associated NlpC family hydrolase